MSLARKLSGSFAPLFSQRRLQQGLLMLALSKILFFNTRINQLFKKQNEMSSFYSRFWKEKNEERQVENIPADDLNTYITKFIIRELKHVAFLSHGRQSEMSCFLI